MKVRVIVAVLVIVFAAAWLSRRAWTAFATQAPALSYSVSVQPGEERGTVSMRIDGVTASELDLQALLPRRHCKIDDLAVTRPAGALGGELALERRDIRLEVGESVSLIPCYRVTSSNDEELGSLVLTYAFSTGVYLTQAPCGERRHLGYMSSDFCYFSAANFVLLPDRCASVSYHFDFPAGFTVMTSDADLVQMPEQSDFWKATVAAGRDHRTLDSDAVSIASFGVKGAEAEAVQCVVEHLTELLGAPEAPFDLVLASRPDDWLRLESPRDSRMIVVDLDQPDISSMRLIIRHCVPAWFGHTPSQLHSADEKIAVLAATTEYLAQTVPQELGLSNTDWRWSAQHTWISERENAAEDHREASGPVRAKMRRVRGPLVVDRALAEGPPAALGALLRHCFSLSTAPSSEAVPAPLQVSKLAAQIDRAIEPFEFEDVWLPDFAVSTPANANRDPLARIVLTSNTAGYLENCGCKVNQSGGIAKRALFIEELLEEHDGASLVLDVGNFAPLNKKLAHISAQEEEEFALYLEAMEKMEYDAVVLSRNEYFLGEARASRLLSGREFVPLASATMKGKPYAGMRDSAILERDGVRFGLVAAFEKFDHPLVHDVHERNTVGLHAILDVEGVIETAQELRDQVDVVIVVGAVGTKSVKALTRSGAIDCILNSADDWMGPDYPPASRVDGTLLVYERAHSYGLSCIDVYSDLDGEGLTCEASSAKLDERFDKSLEIQTLLDHFYEDRAKAVGPISPLFVWDDFAEAKYVGVEKCRECHTEQFKDWRTTSHAHAMSTLRRARRDTNPECVKCHVLGLGREDGYKFGSADKSLEGVQCETCHGAGGDHVKMPTTLNIRRVPTKAVCLECHNSEHSDLEHKDFASVLGQVAHR
jgi:hypothetical protein